MSWPTLSTLLILAALPCAAQPAFDEAGAAPPNPFAAGTVWPSFHRNNYAQAATPLRGPEPGDALTVQRIRLPGRGGTPTQMHISERYADGSYTAWSTNLTHLFKVWVHGDRFQLIDAYQLTRRALDFNVHWNMTLARGNVAFVPSPKTREILKIGEARPGGPTSRLVLLGRYKLPDHVPGMPTVLNLSYDGHLIYITDQAWVGATDFDFRTTTAFDLGRATNDVTTHNSFPIDEQGNLFVASFHAMTKLRWTGRAFELVWRAPYNFRGAGCPPAASRRAEVRKAVTGSGCTGTGTTPTLVGRGSMDRLVVVVDSHPTNNLVAFWRDDPPANWTGLAGQDRRVAGIVPLPHSTWTGAGFTAENSPPVAGYDIAVAQYAGFLRAPCDAPKGVQLVRWDPNARQLRLLWANPAVPFNNIMTLSTGSGLLYGSGRDASCQFVYRGLDRHTGQVRVEQTLGSGTEWLDGGNSNAILPDQSIVYGLNNSMARIRVRR